MPVLVDPINAKKSTMKMDLSRIRILVIIRNIREPAHEPNEGKLIKYE